MARETKCTRSLECKLTDSEKLSYAKEMSERIGKKSASEDQLKAATTQIKADIAGHDARIQAIASKLTSGTEYRDVECEIRYDWKKKIKEIIRKDTGEIIHADIIPDKDLQEGAKL